VVVFLLRLSIIHLRFGLLFLANLRGFGLLQAILLIRSLRAVLLQSQVGLLPAFTHLIRSLRAVLLL
jgi:hypothetical protein